MKVTIPEGLTPKTVIFLCSNHRLFLSRHYSRCLILLTKQGNCLFSPFLEEGQMIPEKSDLKKISVFLRLDM